MKYTSQQTIAFVAIVTISAAFCIAIFGYARATQERDMRDTQAAFQAGQQTEYSNLVMLHRIK